VPDDSTTVVLADPNVSTETIPVPEAKRPKFGVFFWVCSGWLGFLAFITIFASLLPFQNPNNPDYVAGTDAGITGTHWLGTDDLGRDILARFVYGARVSLIIGLLATAIGISIGGFLGMLSAYRRGRLDGALSMLMYTGLAFPAIVAVLAVLSFWGRAEWHIIIVLGLFSVPLIFRLVRSATLACATKEYITAAKSQGAKSLRVLSHDIFPNIAPSLIAYTVFTMGGVIATEGALAFLGYSVLPPTSSWGTMINEASTLDPNNIYLLLAPALGLFFTLICLNYMGERIRVHFDSGEAKL
jgi:peptide/nickel transport system permease protein